MADLQTDIPQEGRTTCGPESLPDATSGCPKDSGGGNGTPDEGGEHPAEHPGVHAVRPIGCGKRDKETEKDDLEDSFLNRLIWGTGSNQDEMEQVPPIKESNKRKRNSEKETEESPEETEQRVGKPQIRKAVALGELLESVRKLQIFCKKNRNVHVPVKELTKEIAHRAGEIQKAIKAEELANERMELEMCEENRQTASKMRRLEKENEILENKIKALSYVATELVDTRKRVSRIERRKSVADTSILAEGVRYADAGVQTDEPCAPHSKQDIRNRIEKMSKTEVKGLIEEDWPEDAFTFKETNDRITQSSGDLVIVADFDNKKEHKLVKHFMGMSRVVANHVREGKMKRGDIITYKTDTTIDLGEEDKREDRRVMLVCGPDNSEDPEEEYITAKKVRERLTLKHQGEVHIARLGGSNERGKKIWECALNGYPLPVFWHTVGERHGRTTQDDPSSMKKKKEDYVVVETQNGSYAETLKRIKENLKGSADADRVTKVSRTRAGHVLMRVQGEVEPLATILRDKVGISKVKSGARTVLYIKGMDGIITEDEVKKEIDTQMGCRGDEVEVRNLRPLNFEGTQAATLLVAKATANKILAAGKIRIGLSSCPVRERIDVQACFKCWEPGHRAAQCRGPDRAKLCRRCGEEGHTALKCDKEPHCPVCGKKGHRANTLRCPKVKDALEKNDKKRGGTGRTTNPQRAVI